MDLNRLRKETAADHDRTEAAVPLMADALTRDEYADVLTRMYGFIRGWEVWAGEHAPGDLRPLLWERQRSGLLCRDLGSLGRPLPEAVAWMPDAAGQPVTRSAFLGRMYVVEGSTLGGQYIAAHVEKTLGFVRGKGNSYFAGYGARTGSMWNEVKQLLVQVPEAESGELIAAARQMFAAFEQWMLLPSGGPGKLRTGSEQDTHA